MGALTRILGASGLVTVVVAGAAACQQTGGTMNVSVVAATTDEQATNELNRQHANVSWLSCAAAYNDLASNGSSTLSEVNVDCNGKTRNNEDISVTGTVYAIVPNECVRGSFTAKVGGKQWFHLGVLGDCSAGETTEPAQNTQDPETKDPDAQDSGTWQPDPQDPQPDDPHSDDPQQGDPQQDDPKPDDPQQDDPQPGPTATVTETHTVWPPEPSCTCDGQDKDK